MLRNAYLDRIIPQAYTSCATAPIKPRSALFVHRRNSDGMADFASAVSMLESEYGFTCTHVSLGYGHNSARDYYRRCLRLAAQAATAELVFLNDASEVISCLPLRPETKVIQLWHACGAFKKWGMSTADKAFGGTEDEKKHHPSYGNLSLVPVSSSAVVPIYCEAMSLEQTPQVVQPLGVARTDCMLSGPFASDARCALEVMYPICKGKRVVFYAPTFRGHVLSAQAPHALDIAQLQHLLGDSWVLLVRHHPFVKSPPVIDPALGNFAIVPEAGLSTTQLLGASDMLVTDYSSIAFEYSLLSRPMVFLANDLEDYASERGWYYPYESFVPGSIVATTDQLAEQLVAREKHFDSTQVEAFRNTFMAACDGNATRRICEWACARL